MNNPRLAARYAKSILDLAVEQNQLDAVFNDMKFVKSVSASNPDFVSMLRSPVITSDKKETIINAVLVNHVSTITGLFINLLVRKTRESNLPEIANAFIEQFNDMKHIRQVKITTAVPISEELQKAIAGKLKLDSSVEKIEIESKVDPALIGGFKLQIGDTLVDASIQRDLLDVRKQFMSNEYIHQIR